MQVGKLRQKIREISGKVAVITKRCWYWLDSNLQVDVEGNIRKFNSEFDIANSDLISVIVELQSKKAAPQSTTNISNLAHKLLVCILFA